MLQAGLSRFRALSAFLRFSAQHMLIRFSHSVEEASRLLFRHTFRSCGEQYNSRSQIRTVFGEMYRNSDCILKTSPIQSELKEELLFFSRLLPAQKRIIADRKSTRLNSSH